MRSLERVNIRTNVRTYVLTYIRTGQTLYPLHNFVVRGDNNNAPHLKSPKNQNRRAALGRPAIKITGGLQLVCGRPTLALSSALVPQTLSCLVCVEDS